MCFAKLPAGTVENLLKPENKAKLAAILTYHVVPGRVLAAEVTGMSSAPTVNGKPLEIRSEGGMVTVGGARVSKTDILCSNGVIHVIEPFCSELVAVPGKAAEDLPEPRRRKAVGAFFFRSEGLGQKFALAEHCPRLFR